MESTEGSGTIILTTIIQAIILVIVLCILYFTAYKPIKRIINRYFQQNEKKAGAPGKKQTIETKRELIDTTSEADKRIWELEDEIAQYQAKMQQSTKEEEKEMLESIIEKTHKTIRRERDSAINKIRKEYDDQILHSKDDVIIPKGEQKDRVNQIKKSGEAGKNGEIKE